MGAWRDIAVMIIALGTRGPDVCFAIGVMASVVDGGDGLAPLDDSLSSASDCQIATSERFLLYDTKYGEGFNLQREVYPRAGWVVAELNKAVKARCGAQVDVPGCARWTLVLPPWCRVVHWWTGHGHLPWSDFFDAHALNKSQVRTIEFHEYVDKIGSQRVDLAIAYTADRLDEASRSSLRDGHGEFAGWIEGFEALGTCGKRKLPQHEVNETSALLNVVYAGQCDGGLDVGEFRCASLKTPFPRCAVDMLATIPDGVRSVLLKEYDFLLAPDSGELDKLGLRESMLFSEQIRAHGEDFIRSVLGSRPYISAHCRRTDFVRVRARTTAEPGELAKKLNSELERSGHRQVFIATDAPGDLREELRAQVNGEVHFFDKFAPSVSLEHPGKLAAVEMWVAARADFFIGTKESRFTAHIQLERGLLGKPRQSSEEEFCKVFDPAAPCLAPEYRHPGRRGEHREGYA